MSPEQGVATNPHRGGGEGMKTLSSDTTIEAERVRIALFRAATAERRFALAESLSRTVLSLSRTAIRQAHPDATEEEAGLLYEDGQAALRCPPS